MKRNVPEVPLWQILLSVRRLYNNPIDVINDSIEKYGDTYITKPGGQKRSIITANAPFIQYVLQKNHSNYEKSELQTDLLAEYLGKGLLTVNGSYWLQQRRLIQPGFHKKKIEALNDIMQKSIIHFCDELEKEIQVNPVIDLNEVMTEVTLHVVAQSLFSTAISKDEINRLGHEVTILQMAIIKDVRLPFLKWWRKLTGEKKKYLNMAKGLQDMVMEIIQRRKESSMREDDLLDMLLDVRYADTNEPMTDQQVLEESLVLLVAGHETSANAMTWLLYLLSHHPEEVQKIRAEIDQADTDYLSMESAMRLGYIGHSISEAMRLYPPAWITDRVALEDDEFDGIAIKKGDIIAPYIYGAHRSDAHWSSPKEYNPNRFEKENMKSKESFAYLPFGGGPRLCIGQSFALLEMKLLVFHLLKRFDFDFVEGQEVELKPLVTLRPKHPMMMKVKAR